MSVICGTCLPGPNCLASDDTLLYSLDSQIYPIVLNCPPGFDCLGNLLDAGTLNMTCCGTVITRSFPKGTTIAALELIIAQMTAACVQLNQFCPGDPGPPPPPPPGGGPPPFQLYFNNAQRCTVLCPDGNPFTAIVNSGLIVGLSQQQADSFAKSLACDRALLNRICLSDLKTTEFCGGSALTITITATGADLAEYPFTDSWSLSGGSLPTGLTFNGGQVQGGVVTITGTPTSGGTFSFTIQVVTPSGYYQAKTYTIQVLNITTTSPLTAGTVGTAYSQTLAETGGTAPFSWQLATGSSLPPGLTLDEQTGKISGTPTTAGTYTFTIICQDSAT